MRFSLFRPLVPTILLAALLLPALSALARPFDSRFISVTNARCRAPVVAPSGLIVWSQVTPAEDPDSIVSLRTDLLTSDAGAEPVNITLDEPLIAGHPATPSPFGASVLYACNLATNAPDGYPFNLELPPLTDEMQQLTAIYPSLFGTPSPAPANEQALAENAENAESPDAPADESAELQPVTDADLAAAAPGTMNRPKRRGERPRQTHGAGNTIVLRTADGNTTVITPRNFGFSFPVLSEDYAAFLCAREWPYGYEIVACDLANQSLIQITTNFFYAAAPAISGHRMAFPAWDGNDYEIYLHDFDAGTTTQITENTFDDTDPHIDGDTIVWVARPLATTEIFLYDIPSESLRKLSDSSTSANSAPSLWNGKVVWQALDDDGNDTEIYYYDGNRIIKLTSNVWDDTTPVIRDNLIAWASYVDLGDAEIMALDLSDNIPVQITDDASDDLLPATAQGFIVWQSDLDDGHSAICIATPHQD